MFCFSCGCKLEYNRTPPNFCVKCGSKVGNASVTEQTEPEVKAEIEESLAEDETNVDQVPQLRGLQVETENYGGSFTLGQMAGKGTPPSYDSKKSSSKLSGLDGFNS